MLSRCRRVTRSFRPKKARAGTISVTTMAKPLKMAPATKYGGKIVVCQPGNDRHGEVEAHHRVDAQHQRRGQGGQEQVGPLVDVPLPGRAPPAQGENAVERTAAAGVVARSRSVARSGIMPRYQNSSRDRGVRAHRKHVPQQRAAEVGPDAHLVGIRDQPIDEPHPADVNAGKMPAQATAKMVIASAARLMLVRHFCRKRNRMAEISVPAWPMPIQNTKLVMSKAQNTGLVVAPHADAGGDQVADQQEEDARHGRARRRRPRTRPRGGRGRSATRQTVSVTEAKSCRPAPAAPAASGRCPVLSRVDGQACRSCLASERIACVSCAAQAW